MEPQIPSSPSGQAHSGFSALVVDSAVATRPDGKQAEIPHGGPEIPRKNGRFDGEKQL